MKEFNKWFTISFSFMGKDFEHTIAIKNVTIDGNIRTSGECYVDGNGVAPAFGINVIEDADVIDYIDDIDIIDAD